MPPGSGERDFTEPAGLEIFAFGLKVMDAGALLHPNLAHPFIDARGLDDGRPFFDCARQRLLDIDVFAGVKRVDGNARMPVIGSGDQDGVDPFIVEQLAVIAERSRVRGLLAGAVDMLAVNIADRRDMHRGVEHKLRHVVRTAVAHPDHPELDRVVRAEYPRIGGRGEGRRAADKCAARHFL